MFAMHYGQSPVRSMRAQLKDQPAQIRPKPGRGATSATSIAAANPAAQRAAIGVSLSAALPSARAPPDLPSSVHA